MKRLIEKTVFSGLVTAWRLATWPTSRSPVLVNATTDGVSRPPSGLVITTGSPPSITATTEFVVPRSMPIILLITSLLQNLTFYLCYCRPYSCRARHRGNIGCECILVNFTPLFGCKHLRGMELQLVRF